MNNEIEQLTDYFLSLATQYTEIGHTAAVPRFFQYSLSEIKNPNPGAIMYMSPPISTAVEQDGSQIMRLIVDISIMENFGRQNFPEMQTAIRNSYMHCKEILAKINADKLNDNPTNDTACLLARFSPDDAIIQVDDARLDGWIGCTLSLRFDLSEVLQITPALWQ